MSKSAKLLTPPHNFAIVQLPERNFPGVVFQGDTVSTICQELDSVRTALSYGDIDEAVAGLEPLIDQMRVILKRYETVCKENGLEIPYAIRHT